MGVLGDIMDRWQNLPPVGKVAVIGGAGLVAFVAWRMVSSGGAGGGSSSSVPIDLASPAANDAFSTGVPGQGVTTVPGQSGQTGTAPGLPTGTTGGTGSSGSKPPTTGTGGTKKPPTKKPPVHKPPTHKTTASGKVKNNGTTGAHRGTVDHIIATANTTKHPNIGWGTHAGAKPVTNEGNSKRVVAH